MMEREHLVVNVLAIAALLLLTQIGGCNQGVLGVSSNSLFYGAGDTEETLTLSNTGGASLTYTMTLPAGVTVPTGSETGDIAAGASINVVVTIDRTTVTTATIAIAAGTAGSQNVQVTTEPNRFTQQIAAGANALTSRGLLFEPDGSINFYSRTLIDLATFANVPVALGTPTAINFGTADPFQLDLPGVQVSYYGTLYSTLFVSSKGWISFGVPGNNPTDVGTHFLVPQISVLPIDATAGGAVSFEVFNESVVIDYNAVPTAGGTATNTFQVEFDLAGTPKFDASFASNSFVLTYTNADINAGGIIGLSNGQTGGLNQNELNDFINNFVPTDLTGGNTQPVK